MSFFVLLCSIVLLVVLYFLLTMPVFSCSNTCKIHTGNKISTQTGIGTIIAIAGVAIYSLIKANLEEKKGVNFIRLFFIMKYHVKILNMRLGIVLSVS